VRESQVFERTYIRPARRAMCEPLRDAVIGNHQSRGFSQSDEHGEAHPADEIKARLEAGLQQIGDLPKYK